MRYTVIAIIFTILAIVVSAHAPHGVTLDFTRPENPSAQALNVQGDQLPVSIPDNHVHEIKESPLKNQTRHIRAAIIDHYPPYSFINEKGRPDGYAVDLAKAVAKAMGMELIIRSGTREQSMGDLKNGAVDFLPMMSYSKKRDEAYDFSGPHTLVYDALFIRKGSPAPGPVEKIRNQTIIVMKNDLAHEFVRNSGLSDHNKVLEADSLESALGMLSQNRGTLALLPKLAGLVCIKNQGYRRVDTTPVVVEAYERRLCFATREGNLPLLEKLSQGLNIIKSTGEYKTIYDQWFGQLEPRGISIRDALKYAGMGIAAFSAAGLILLFWSVMLRREVRERTAELKSEVTGHKITENALRRNESLLRKILDTLPVGVWIVDDQGRIIDCNPAGRQIWGGALFVGPERYGEYKGKWVESGKIVEPWEWGIARALKNGETSSEEEIEIECFDGTRKTILHWAAPIFNSNGAIERVIGVNQDITERRRAEDEKQKLHDMLAQAQKMESIGRLAGGVAHDFNNMLSIIMGYAELTRTMIDSSDRITKNLNQIISAGNRSKEVVRQLLAFARKQPIAPKVLCFNHVVEDFLKMLRRLIGENVELQWKPSGNLWPVRMDPTQVEQILTNLTVNARDAIGVNAGLVTLETGNAFFDQTYCETHPGFRPGEYVLLAVSDTGCGMDKETQANIFEPFYTTKETGKGTGLGLATVYGIVKQNDGFVYVYSEIDQGTTFKIYIPRSTTNDLQDGRKHLPGNPPEGRETILLVEDEPFLLDMAKLMLEQLGYRVIMAGSPKEALEIADRFNDEIHLLVTDVVMPGMVGSDLSKKLTTRCPNIKHLFMSGYTAHFMTHHGVLSEDVHFIHKPFSLNDFAIKIREALC